MAFMTIVRLEGGLGNQLFQYAAGLALSKRLGTQLKVDLSWFGTQAKRSYRLDRFEAGVEYARPLEVGLFTGDHESAVLSKLLGLFRRTPCAVFFRTFRENETGLNPGFWHLRQNVYLHGYWQSESYFEDVSEVVKQEYILSDVPSPPTRRVAQKIRSVPRAVAVHVRRGDYVAEAETRAFHGACSSDYYTAAAEFMVERHPRSTFFLFSDDPEWARENIVLAGPCEVVDHNGPERDYEDLHLMSLCEDHIIANSTFSWWGAWLSEDGDTHVVAPRRWFRVQKPDSHIVPDRWIRI
jgi:hypothetical protein